MIKRWRIVLSGLILVTAAVVLSSFFQSRKETRPSLEVKPLNANIQQSLEGLEYTESRDDRVVLRVRAAKYIQSTDKKKTLQGIEATHYSESDSGVDTIKSQTVESDASNESTLFKEKVSIQTKEGTEITTDSFTYHKSKDQAESLEKFHFKNENFSGDGKGFIYEFKTGILRISEGAEFRLQKKTGEASDSHRPGENPEVRVRSQKAELTHDFHLKFMGEALISQQTYALSASTIHIEMDSKGEKIQKLWGSEGAWFHWLEPGQGQEKNLAAEHVEMLFSSETGNPERITALSGAFFQLVSPHKEITKLTASQIQIDLNQNGLPTRLQTEGNTEIGSTSKTDWTWIQGGVLTIRFFQDRTEPMDAKFDGAARFRHFSNGVMDEFWSQDVGLRFQDRKDTACIEYFLGKNRAIWKRGQLSPKLVPSDPFLLGKLEVEVQESLAAEQVQVDFFPGLNSPSVAAASGGSLFQSKSMQEGDLIERKVSSSWMRLDFLKDKKQIHRIEAGPWAKMEENSAKEKKEASCQQLEAIFSPKEGHVQDVRMNGNFHLQQTGLSLFSQSAVYHVPSQAWKLSGGIRFIDTDGITTAREAEITESGERIRASGQVRCLFESKSSISTSLPVMGGSVGVPLLVTSDMMEANRKTDMVFFEKNAKASRGENSIRAGQITLHQKETELVATGSVNTYFHQAPAPGRRKPEDPKKESKTTGTMEINAERLSYKKADQFVEYFGDIKMSSDEVALKAPHLKIFLNDTGETVKSAHAWGGVEIARGGLKGNGIECQYDPGGNRLVLIGKPAVVTDPNRGRSSGSRLTLTLSDDKILIES